MSQFTERFARDENRYLHEIRVEVGWPENTEDFEEFDSDLMWRYIEALENQLAAERWVREREGLRNA